MKKQYVVIGLGRFGSSLAETLATAGNEVLAIDSDEARVQQMTEILTHVIAVDSTDETALRSLGIRNFDIAIVAIGQNVQASIFTTLLLKELGVKYVVAKADSLLHGNLLEKVGADRVVFPERDMGKRVAHNLMSTNTIDYFEVAPDLGIIEVKVPRALVNTSLKRSNLRQVYGITVLAIRRDNQFFLSPNPDEIFLEKDQLILVGESEGLQRFEDKYE